MTRRRPDFGEGLAHTRQALVPGTGGGRYLIPTQYRPQATALGLSTTATQAANARVRIEWLWLTATAQTIANGGGYVTWDTEVLDPARIGWGGYGTLPSSSIVLPLTGLYAFDYSHETSAAVGPPQVEVAGTKYKFGTELVKPGDTGTLWLPEPFHAPYNAGETLKVWVPNAAGASITVDAALMATVWDLHKDTSTAEVGGPAADPALWYRPEELVNLGFTQGQKITQWPNAATAPPGLNDANFDLTTAASDTGPVFDTTQLAQPVANFDLAANLTGTMAPTGVVSGNIDSQPATMFAVMSTRSGAVNRYAITGKDGTHQRVISNYLGDTWLHVAGGNGEGVGKNGSTTSEPVPMVPKLVRVVFNTTASTVHTNGSQVFSGDVGSNACNGLILSNANGLHDGIIGEVLYYPRLLTAAEITQTETYLRDKFGV